MRITCPSCSAAYEVPDHLVGAARTVRCARCGHYWGVAGKVAAEKAIAAPELMPGDPILSPAAVSTPEPTRSGAPGQEPPLPPASPDGPVLDSAMPAPSESASPHAPERLATPEEPPEQPSERPKPVEMFGPPTRSPPSPAPAAAGPAAPVPDLLRTKPTRPEPLTPARLAPPPPSTPKRRRRSGAATALAWVASLAVLGLVLWAGYVRRAEIMQAWPPSVRLYEAVGLKPR